MRIFSAQTLLARRVAPFASLLAFAAACSVYEGDPGDDHTGIGGAGSAASGGAGGVVCKNLTSTATQIVSITSQSLDSGYTSFYEDCTGGRFLTDLAGLPDSNSLSHCVGQIGGECSAR